MWKILKASILAGAAAAMLSACTTPIGAMRSIVNEPAISEVVTETQSSLRALPPPRERAAVAVYSFEDQTGQFKPTSGVQTLSKAVTQGSTSVLLKALQDAGNRSWFTVIERENLDNLLKERQIIREMRRQYLGEEDVNEAALPPLLFAGIILEGGIIGYDSNTVTGGAGARFLGIGAHANYREDKVTVYLRAVSVKTGEVITTVVASKKIASVGVASNVFRYVSFKELLEVDTGITTNEPDLLALRQATEKAVELLILEGADLGVWGFADRVAGADILEQYRAERDGVFDDMESAYASRSTAPVRQAAVSTTADQEVSAAEAALPAGTDAQRSPPQSDVESKPATQSPQPSSMPLNKPVNHGKRRASRTLTNSDFLPKEGVLTTVSNTKFPVQEQITAQTISAVPAVVIPVAQGDGADGQTTADFYKAAISSLPALSGSSLGWQNWQRRAWRTLPVTSRKAHRNWKAHDALFRPAQGTEIRLGGW
ncbi:CsgG/HfaB family protein [Henriciella sp. AS95]|uniref:CsgG/HfaB family protein n=1 Tax=Henriciella sp. AS95 TaxID=3135782 RepID=UPI00317A5E7D